MKDPFETNFTKAQAANEDNEEGSRDVYEAIASLQRELQQGHPSLPANLDEAAEKCRWKLEEHYGTDDNGNYLYDEDAIEDAFKAGAEWMAGQGETKQGVVTKDDFIQFADNTYIDLDPKLELTPAFSLKDAKEVVVQVRKK